MGIPEHLTCLFRNLYEGPEATVRTGHGTTDWFQIGKGVRQGCILSPCLFNASYLFNAYLMLPDESESGELKSWLKAQHSENEDHGIRSHHFVGNRWGNSGNCQTLFFWGPKSLQMVIAAMKLKDAYSLEGKL